MHPRPVSACWKLYAAWEQRHNPRPPLPSTYAQPPCALLNRSAEHWHPPALELWHALHEAGAARPHGKEEMMDTRVFLARATGAIGTRLVPLLLQHRAVVFGTTRS